MGLKKGRIIVYRYKFNIHAGICESEMINLKSTAYLDSLVLLVSKRPRDIPIMGASLSRAKTREFDNKHGGQEVWNEEGILRNFYVILILISTQRQGREKQ